MKTPREILLARHRAAEPRLDAIRESSVAAVCNRRVSTDRTNERRSQTAATMMAIWRVLWHELILPARRTWAGLAAAWLVLLIVNFSQREPLSSTTGQPVRSPVVMMSWQIQQRWMNELLSDRSIPPEAERPRTMVPGPRTENFGPVVV